MHSERRAAIFGWLASLLVHGALLAYIAFRTTAPDVGFDFQLPTEVELGLSEAVITSAGGSPPAPAPAEPTATPGGEGPGEAAAIDAGAPDAGPPQPEEPPALAQGEGEGDAEEGPGEGDEGDGDGVAFLPAGAQIALRLDVARVRASALAPDVRQVLAAMPDWQALLEGSGIEPLDDMDRLLVASPNLQRSRLVAAGRASGDEATIRAAAERLATAQGESLEWRQIRGVPVADWHDRDPTARVVALIGPRHFVIAREEDVPRVIAVARARASDDEEDDEEPSGPREHPADALLSMKDGEGLSLEVEGFRNFARARPNRASLDALPLKLRVGLTELSNQRIGARIEGRFEDAAQAEAAVAYWDRMREAYARNVITAVLGLAPILQRLEMRADGSTMRARVDIEVGEMRRLLNLVRSFFEDRARVRQPAAPPSMPSAPPAPSAPAPILPSEPPPSPY